MSFRGHLFQTSKPFSIEILGSMINTLVFLENSDFLKFTFLLLWTKILDPIIFVFDSWLLFYVRKNPLFKKHSIGFIVKIEEKQKKKHWKLKSRTGNRIFIGTNEVKLIEMLVSINFSIGEKWVVWSKDLVFYWIFESHVNEVLGNT